MRSGDAEWWSFDQAVDVADATLDAALKIVTALKSVSHKDNRDTSLGQS
jgi:hypothetical protein